MDSAGSDYYQGGPGPNIPNLMEMPFQTPMGPPGENNYGNVLNETVVGDRC